MDEEKEHANGKEAFEGYLFAMSDVRPMDDPEGSRTNIGPLAIPMRAQNASRTMRTV
ncbi:MAG: hypothetical protein LLG16_09385 [Euryarchaeota archaeon]|nr:hypothetical protein [Euryarchaeota archaeon]